MSSDEAELPDPDDVAVDPDDAISAAESIKQQQAADAHTAFEWFEERSGTLHPTEDALELIADEHEWGLETATRALIGLVDDSLDPVQQVISGDDRLVGILDFIIFEQEGAYAFEEYDDTIGRRKNVVCARCVELEDHPDECFRAVAGHTSYPADEDDSGDPRRRETIPLDAGYKPLLDRVTQHYTHAHEAGPSSVDVAASLVSGTTISSSTAWHDGNVSGGSNINIGGTSVSVSPQGSGSGLAADSTDGYDIQKNGSDTNGVINMKT